MTCAQSRKFRRDRRGASLALVALLLPLLIGFMALSVDTAIVATARSQLRTTADAAALAGAVKLVDQYILYGSNNASSQISSAQAQARLVGQANTVLGQAPVLLDNSGNSATGDVLVGYVSPPPSRTWTPPPLSSPFTANSVRVNAYRDASHGGDVPLAFAAMYGFRSTPVANIQGTATAWSFEIEGFKGNGDNVNLLPIVLNKSNYDAMMAGTTPDSFTYNSATNAVTDGPDGLYESRLYPVSTGNPGKWGTVKIGVSNNSTSTLGAQIRYGITASQMATYPNSTIQLDQGLNPPSITFGGDPRISAGIKDDLASIIGKPVTIPIYDQSGGNGNNAWYRVIAFAAVRLLDVNSKGGDKYVIVQPAILRDPSAIPGDPNASWSQGGLIRLYLTQ